MKYKLTVCGGTFDLLHKGHKKFLEKAFFISDKVLIGVNTDKFSQEHGKNLYQDQEERKKEVEKYLEEKGWLGRVEFHFHDDFLNCPAVNEANLESIIVSSETVVGGREVNKQRKTAGLEELEIVTAELEKDQGGGVISSSRIRNGEIDRDGKLYVNPGWNGKRLLLPESLRNQLTQPFGNTLQVIPEELNSARTITVGDETTKKFNENKINHKVSIVDFVVKRKRKFDKLEDLSFEERIKTHTVDNPPGEVTWNMFEGIKKGVFDKERSVILVNGEEDLAVLPAVLLAPLGFTIYYGQPDVGLIEVKVTENKKQEAYRLASRFELS